MCIPLESFCKVVLVKCHFLVNNNVYQIDFYYSIKSDKFQGLYSEMYAKYVKLNREVSGCITCNSICCTDFLCNRNN